MHGDILLDIPVRLVGGAPNPGPDASASGRTRLSARLCAPFGRWIAALRAAGERRVPRRSRLRRSQRVRWFRRGGGTEILARAAPPSSSENTRFPASAFAENPRGEDEGNGRNFAANGAAVRAIFRASVQGKTGAFSSTQNRARDVKSVGFRAAMKQRFQRKRSRPHPEKMRGPGIGTR